MTNGTGNRIARDDELLSALIDGELGAAEAAALEARLAAEPELARRLAALREADSALRGAYGPLADAPADPRLTALIQGHRGTPAGPRQAQEAAANVVPLRRRSRTFWVPSSIAAGIALAVGLGLGLSIGQRDKLSDTERLLASGAPIGPGRDLYDVIESVPSRQSATLAGNLAATPRLTFRTADGGYCREVALSSALRQTTFVACRESTDWRLEAVMQVRGPESGTGDGFVPASGPAAALDTVVDGLIAGEPLGADAEREAIASAWE